ncbi:HET-domain-containing protein, partial [Trichodelitschia bisporula]
MALCSICKNIDFFNLPDFPKWLPSFHRPLDDHDLVPYMPSGSSEEPRVLGVPHHPSLAALRTAAAACPICQLIDRGIVRVEALIEEGNKDSGYVARDNDGPPVYQLWMCKREDADGFMVLSPARDSHNVYLIAAAGYCVEDDSPLGSRFSGRIVYPDPMHPTVLARFQTWLKECDGHNHPPLQYDLPTRILDLDGPDGIVKLLEPGGGSAPYVALSHCWGPTRELLTTKDTLQDRKKAISVSAMPQTFKDAVRLTRTLGLRYLWIDSLCIIQDDRADWEYEAARMAGVYAKSYLTIIASRGASDTEGFLGSRGERRNIPLSTTISGVSGTVYAFYVPQGLAAFNTDHAKMADEPISVRAWTLQERYLPMRKLHFATSQACYECLAHFRTEDGWVQTGTEYSLEERHGPYFQGAPRGSTRWQTILSEYSERKLTNPSDKLPALSGLAQAAKAAGLVKGEYVAGLWRDNFVEELGWQGIGGRSSHPPEPRGPSWSWASVDNGPIGTTNMGSWGDLIEIDDIDVPIKGLNPYGEVGFAVAKLRVCLIKVTPKPTETRAGYPHPRLGWCMEGWDAEDGIFCTWDTGGMYRPLSEVEGRDWNIFPLAWARDDSDESVPEEDRDVASLGLLVERIVPGEPRFRRVGFCFIYRLALIRGWIKQKQRGELEAIVF